MDGDGSASISRGSRQQLRDFHTANQYVAKYRHGWRWLRHCAPDVTDIFVEVYRASRVILRHSRIGAKISPSNPAPFIATPPANCHKRFWGLSGLNYGTVGRIPARSAQSLWTDEKTDKPKAKSITLTFTAAQEKPHVFIEVMVLDRLLSLNSDGGLLKGLNMTNLGYRHVMRNPICAGSAPTFLRTWRERATNGL